MRIILIVFLFAIISTVNAKNLCPDIDKSGINSLPCYLYYDSLGRRGHYIFLGIQNAGLIERKLTNDGPHDLFIRFAYYKGCGQSSGPLRQEETVFVEKGATKVYSVETTCTLKHSSPMPYGYLVIGADGDDKQLDGLSVEIS